MVYSYMTLNDGTEIVHSELYNDGRVKVYMETPDKDKGFLHATCWLPSNNWEDIYGYSAAQMERLQRLIKNNAHLIIEFAQTGGVDGYMLGQTDNESDGRLAKVCKVVPHEDYTVDVFFSDGEHSVYDAKPLVGKGVFSVLSDMDFFLSRCTVMNDTLAWDLTGENDPAKCLDIAPEALRP